MAKVTPKENFLKLAKGEFPYHKIGKIPPLIGISPLLVLKRVLSLQQNKKKLFHR